jgi:nucleoside-diphosphate-sugar epimerase
MKVFIAGATGVLGRRAVAEFVGAGFDVTAIARAAPKQALVRGLGATPVEVGLFDRDGLARAVAGHDVVCNLATAIPTGEGAADLAAWEENNRIRTEGARNLVDAALAGGAQRYVQESIALLYADGGDDELDEDSPLAPTWTTETARRAEAEAARFAAEARAGVALRFATFYGPDSAHTIEAIHAAAAGIGAELGPADAFRSSITTDDAGAAVVAALRAPSGVYNVADDRALRRSEYLDALARVLGSGPLALPPTPALPAEFEMLARSQRVSNRRFAAVTGWSPRFPSAWEGWPHVVAEYRARSGTGNGAPLGVAAAVDPARPRGGSRR